jgi:hypothetical protein
LLLRTFQCRPDSFFLHTPEAVKACTHHERGRGGKGARQHMVSLRRITVAASMWHWRLGMMNSTYSVHPQWQIALFKIMIGGHFVCVVAGGGWVWVWVWGRVMVMRGGRGATHQRFC